MDREVSSLHNKMDCLIYLYSKFHLHPLQAAGLLTLVCHLRAAELGVPTLGDVQGGQVDAGKQGQV